MPEGSRIERGLTAVIVQPMFFPWRGQFDLQSRADIVIVLDTVQWVRRHWYNRNLIAGSTGKQWITVPVSVQNHRDVAIANVAIDGRDETWRRKMLNALRHAYGHSPYFNLYYPEIERLLCMPWRRMAPLAEATLRFGFKALGQPSTMVRASELAVEADEPIGRLVALCRAVGAERYLSGPAAKSYIGDNTAFADAGIELQWMTYGYPAYPRKNPPSDEELSILDLLFNTGPEARHYIWPNNRK